MGKKGAGCTSFLKMITRNVTFCVNLLDVVIVFRVLNSISSSSYFVNFVDGAVSNLVIQSICALEESNSSYPLHD